MIRQQMEETRESLTSKLETLENKVVGTVQEATTAVAETVDSVKNAVAQTVDSVKDGFTGTVEAVKETATEVVDSVKETFDLRHQFDKRPWVMFGGSVALGFLGGWLLPRRQPRDSRDVAGDFRPVEGQWRDYGPQPRQRPAPREREEERAEEEEGPGLIGGLVDKFAPELSQVKELALGATLGLFRDLLRRNLPENLQPQATQIVDNVTTKLGGRPVSAG